MVTALDSIGNLVGGRLTPPRAGAWLEKLRPADGLPLCRVARSGAEDIAAAVEAARAAQPEWAEHTAVARGELVREIALALRERCEELSQAVAEETGKPLELALGETDTAVEMGFFVAGEGRRYHGRTTTASIAHRTVMAVRQPVGVAGLIISFNTPLPNVAWKVFPAVFCGNAAVLKPSEQAPLSAHLFATACQEVGLPPGVLNVVQGLGSEAGVALVEHPRVDLVSFTGSAATGRWIAEAAAGWPRSASSWAARTPWSSATTPTWRTPSAGLAPRPSPTPASGAPPRAGSSRSIRSTRSSASASWRRSRVRGRGTRDQ